MGNKSIANLIKKDYAFLEYPEIQDVCIEYDINDDETVAAMYEVLRRMHDKIYSEAEDYYQHKYDDYV